MAATPAGEVGEEAGLLRAIRIDSIMGPPPPGRVVSRGAVGDIGGGLGAEGRMATQGQNNMHGKGKPAASKQSAQRRPRKKQTDEEKAAKKLDALNQRYRCSAI